MYNDAWSVSQRTRFQVQSIRLQGSMQLASTMFCLWPKCSTVGSGFLSDISHSCDQSWQAWQVPSVSPIISALWRPAFWPTSRQNAWKEGRHTVNEGVGWEAEGQGRRCLPPSSHLFHWGMSDGQPRSYLNVLLYAWGCHRLGNHHYVPLDVEPN